MSASQQACPITQIDAIPVVSNDNDVQKYVIQMSIYHGPGIQGSVKLLHTKKPTQKCPVYILKTFVSQSEAEAEAKRLSNLFQTSGLPDDVLFQSEEEAKVKAKRLSRFVQTQGFPDDILF